MMRRETHINPLTDKVFNWDFHSFEIVSSTSIIQIWHSGGQLFSILADWCHVLSFTAYV